VRKTTVALFLTALLVPSLASASSATAAAPAGACADTSGVSVVVDLTDLGGDVVAGCAPGDPTTGRQALIDAGFVAADDAAGMICAIDSLPNPCPATFEGSYWSYWSAEPTTDWVAYAVGADSSDPAPGSIEGWRYNDGSTGPGVLPAELEVADAAATSASETAAPSTAPVAADSSESNGPSGASIAGLGVLAVLLAAAVVVVRRRRAAAQSADDSRG